MRLRREGHYCRRTRGNSAQRSRRLAGLLSRVWRPAVCDPPRVSREQLASGARSWWPTALGGNLDAAGGTSPPAGSRRGVARRGHTAPGTPSVATIRMCVRLARDDPRTMLTAVWTAACSARSSRPANASRPWSASPPRPRVSRGLEAAELMEYMGHSSLQATERYVKLLPPLDERDPAERLNAFLRRRAHSG